MEESLEDILKRIPEDRHDEMCLNCGHGHLAGDKILRRWPRHIQYLFKCNNCGDEVVMIDELEDVECPCCGDGFITQSHYDEYMKEREKRK
jgi:ribosomal protein S27AE